MTCRLCGCHDLDACAPVNGQAMHRLLDALDGAGVEAYGMAHGNGTVQLTLKGDPQVTKAVLDGFYDSVITGGLADEEES